jgi:hypothetical protein
MEKTYLRGFRSCGESQVHREETDENKPRCQSGALLISQKLGRMPRTHVLGYSQPSLRDWSVVSNPTQDSRPGLLSAVPAGLNSEPAVSRRGYKAVVFSIVCGPTRVVPSLHLERNCASRNVAIAGQHLPTKHIGSLSELMPGSQQGIGKRLCQGADSLHRTIRLDQAKG